MNLEQLQQRLEVTELNWEHAVEDFKHATLNVDIHEVPEALEHEQRAWQEFEEEMRAIDEEVTNLSAHEQFEWALWLRKRKQEANESTDTTPS